MNKYIENVLHLKKKLEKGVSYEKTLHILHKLQKIPITIELLHKTGIGKTVRHLSKQQSDSDVGKTAKLLCGAWKTTVKEEQEREEQREESVDEDDNNDNDNQDYDDDEPEEPTVKEEPEEEESEEEPIHRPVKNRSHERNGHKIKTEYISHEDEEEEEEEPNESYNSKRKHNEEKSSDRKHSRKHKSSHKSRESEPKVKTEFEALLGLNDEMIVRNNSKNKSSSATKKSETSEKYTKLLSNNHSVDNKSHIKSVKSEKMDVVSDRDHKSKSKSKSHEYKPTALEMKPKLQPMDILSDLPTHDYKPLPNRELIDERVEAANRRKAVKTNDELSYKVQRQRGRTAVFAGQARAPTYTHVHKLEDLCIGVLTDNIDKIHYLDDAPYYLLKPVLQKCTLRQLTRIEKLNPQILEDTDELWKGFCNKEYRGKEPDSEEDECWRELYLRCGQERDNRLKNITKFISNKQQKALPVRQTQFSENVKTPREILRKQERSGISQSYGSSGGGGGGGSGGYSSQYVKIVPEKPKVAPLMRKVLKLQKARNSRR